jgi:RimJ/RimL family protein N-acetyltransferase
VAVRIIAADDLHFAALIAGTPLPGLGVADGGIESPEVLAMLRDLAATIRPQFAPAAWVIVHDAEIVGLCSLVAPPDAGTIHIGYGIAASRRRHGHASAGVQAVAEWARHDLRVSRVAAETALDNLPSQRVLEQSGFTRTGIRIDHEDGALICWGLALD